MTLVPLPKLHFACLGSTTVPPHFYHLILMGSTTPLYLGVHHTPCVWGAPHPLYLGRLSFYLITPLHTSEKKCLDDRLVGRAATSFSTPTSDLVSDPSLPSLSPQLAMSGEGVVRMVTFSMSCFWTSLALTAWSCVGSCWEGRGSRYPIDEEQRLLPLGDVLTITGTKQYNDSWAGQSRGRDDKEHFVMRKKEFKGNS